MQIIPQELKTYFEKVESDMMNINFESDKSKLKNAEGYENSKVKVAFDLLSASVKQEVSHLVASLPRMFFSLQKVIKLSTDEDKLKFLGEFYSDY